MRRAYYIPCLFIILSIGISNTYAETATSEQTIQDSVTIQQDTLELLTPEQSPQDSVAQEQNDSELPSQGVEIRLLPLFSRGLSLDYERWIFERMSLLGGFGIRSSAMGDYSGLAMTLSLGSRFWLHKGGPSWFSAPYSGFFADAILNFQLTTVYDDIDDEELESTYTTGLGLGGGFRFAIVQRVTLTMTGGVLMRVDNPEGPARSQSRANIQFGLRAGYLF